MEKKDYQNIFADLRNNQTKSLTQREAKLSLKENLYPHPLWILSSESEAISEEVVELLHDQPVAEFEQTSIVEKSFEKEEILKSMEKFVAEQGAAVELEGAKVSSTASGNHYHLKFEKEAPKSISELGDIPYNFVQSPTSKIAFVGEKPKDWDEENPGTDLLSKMVKAMGLDIQKTALLFIDKNEDEKTQELIYRELYVLGAEIVVALGARATSLLINKKERLSSVHGRFLKIEVEFQKENRPFEIFPVFHPDYLQINPSMKRTAWEDLQKVMKRIS